MEIDNVEEEIVTQVDSVCIELKKSNPPTLDITAFGSVNSSGWSGGRLDPYVYAVFPEDGIQDFSFVATKPGGVAAQVMSAISANTSWQVYAGVLKGVRVHSAQKVIEVHLYSVQ